eukprot:8884316-Karenia_brevis.AAC.1
MLAADAQRKAVGIEEDTKPRKLPGPERNARMAAVRQELVGLSVHGIMEPSHTLVDKFVAMKESGELRYVPWKELTTREAELKGNKTEEIILKDTDGRLRQSNRKVEDPVDLSSDSRWRYALQRRGIAMQMAGLATYSCHQRLVQWLERELMHDALPGYSRPTLDQVKRADFEVFMRVTELLEEDLSVRADNSLPIDSVLPGVLLEPRIQAIMVPLPAASGSKREPNDEVAQLREQVKRLKGNNKGFGKGGKNPRTKSGGARAAPPLPAALKTLNCVPLPSGQKACYAFNLQGCSNGSNCPKGAHKCLVRGCGATDHGASNHRG